MTYAYFPAYSEGTTEKQQKIQRQENNEATSRATQKKTKEEDRRPSERKHHEERHLQPDHQRQPRLHRPGFRPVRTRQGLLRPDEEGPQQVRLSRFQRITWRAAASTTVVVGGRLGYRAYEDYRTAMARGTCVSAAADLDRAAKECRNPLGADATKSARPSSIIQIDRNLLETKLDRLVAEKVTEPLNAMPGASGRRDRQRRQIRARRGAEGVPRRPLRPEPDRQGRQARPEGAQAQGRGLRIRGHRAPQTARGKRRPAAISTGPGSMTNSRKRTDHRAMDGHGPKCTSFRALPRRSQLYRGY